MLGGTHITVGVDDTAVDYGLSAGSTGATSGLSLCHCDAAVTDGGSPGGGAIIIGGTIEEHTIVGCGKDAGNFHCDSIVEEWVNS